MKYIRRNLIININRNFYIYKIMFEFMKVIFIAFMYIFKDITIMNEFYKLQRNIVLLFIEFLMNLRKTKRYKEALNLFPKFRIIDSLLSKRLTYYKSIGDI